MAADDQVRTALGTFAADLRGRPEAAPLVANSAADPQQTRAGIVASASSAMLAQASLNRDEVLALLQAP